MSIDMFPLTQPQQRVWHTQQLHQDSQMFNIGGYAVFYGNLDCKILAQSIVSFVKANDAFRIAITEIKGKYMQYLRNDTDVKIPHYDFMAMAGCKSQESKTAQELWLDCCKEHVHTPFQLESGPFYEFFTFRLDENKFGYFVKLHHVIADGWSIQLLTDYMVQYYENYPDAIPEKAGPSYFVMINEECKYMESVRFKKDRSFWIEKFTPRPERLSHPNDALNGFRSTYYLSSDRLCPWLTYLKKSQITKSVFFTALHLYYLYALTKNTDLVVSLPVMGRSRKNGGDTFGMLTSIVPLRFQLDPQEAVGNCLLRLASEMSIVYRHHKYPYNILLKDLNIVRDSYGGLFNTSVNYYSTKPFVRLDGMSVCNEEFYSGEQDYALQLIIREWSDSDELRIDCDCQMSVFQRSDIDSMVQWMTETADWILLKDGLTVDQICRQSGIKIDIPGFSFKLREIKSRDEVPNNLPVLKDATSFILNIPDIKDSDNFLYLGGDSISAIQMSSHLKKKGYQISASEVIAHPILSDMSHFLKRSSFEQPEEQNSGFVRTTPMMKWFFQQKFKHPNGYLQGISLRIKSFIVTKNLKESIEQMLIFHPVLHMRVEGTSLKIKKYEAYGDGYDFFSVYDLTTMPREDWHRYIKQCVAKQSAEIDIYRARMLQSCLFITGEQENLLVFIIHHLSVDGYSWRIIIDELNQRLINPQGVSPKNLPHTMSYEKWSVLTEGKRPTIALGTPVSDYGVFTHEIDSDTAALLRTCICEPDLVQDDYWLAAILQTLADVERKLILVELERQGRDLLLEADVSYTVGWFTDIRQIPYALEAKPMSSRLRDCRSMRSVLKESDCNASPKPDFVLRFNNLGSFHVIDDGPISLEEGGLPFLFERGLDKRNHATCDLEINLVVASRAFIMTRYNAKLWDENSVGRFLDDVIHLVHELLLPYRRGAFGLTEGDLNTLLDSTVGY